MEAKEGKIILTTPRSTRTDKAVINSAVAHIKNLLNGLEKKYVYKLTVVYSHFPITIAKKGNTIEVNNFLGSKHPKVAKINGKAEVEIKGKEMKVLQQFQEQF